MPYYNEHPLVNEAIRQVEKELQKQQEKRNIGMLPDEIRDTERG